MSLGWGEHLIRKLDLKLQICVHESHPKKKFKSDGVPGFSIHWRSTLLITD